MPKKKLPTVKEVKKRLARIEKQEAKKKSSLKSSKKKLRVPVSKADRVFHRSVSQHQAKKSKADSEFKWIMGRIRASIAGAPFVDSDDLFYSICNALIETPKTAIVLQERAAFIKQRVTVVLQQAGIRVGLT